jgi:hypothetical protein
MYDHPDHPLTVEVTQEISAEDAKEIQRQTIIGLQAVYANERSPYPGQITNVQECATEFIPEYNENHVLLYSTVSLGVGACTEDTAIHRMLIGWRYCESQETLYTIQYHTPKDENPVTFFESMRCS